MAKRKLFCPNCAELINPDDTVCPRCKAEVQFDADEIMMDLALKARKKSLIPWGLILFFALYLIGVKFFCDNYYKGTVEYRAAVKFREGDLILGEDDGKTIDDQRLAQAFWKFVEGTKLTPGDDYGHDRIETILRRLNERHLALTDTQRRELDLLARMKALDYQRKKPMLFVGVRDIWNIDALEELPLKIFRASLFFAIFVLVVWILKSWQVRKYYDKLASQKIEERRIENMSEEEYAEYLNEKRRKLMHR